MMQEQLVAPEFDDNKKTLFDIRKELETSTLPPAIKEGIVKLFDALEKSPESEPVAYTGRGEFIQVVSPDTDEVIQVESSDTAEITLYRKGTGLIPEAREQGLDGIAQRYPIRADLDSSDKARLQILRMQLSNLRRDEGLGQLGLHGRIMGELNHPKFRDPLYYDSIESPNPRLRGVIRTSEGMLEALNALVVLEGLSETHKDQWRSEMDILADGVTIPMKVVEDRALSREMGKLIAQRRLNEEKEVRVSVARGIEKELPPGLISDANDHLGQIDLIVPDHTRLDTLAKKGNLYEDPVVGVQSAKTLRELRQIGVVYGAHSSHPQNQYVRGGYADCGDLVFLGDYDHQAQKRQVIFTHLNRRSGMFPFPSVYPESKQVSESQAEAEYKKMKEYFSQFWSEYLRDDLEGVEKTEMVKRVENLFRIMAFFRSETNLALTQLCLDRFDEPEYARRSSDLSKRRADLFNRHDAASLPLNTIIAEERAESIFTKDNHLVELSLDAMEAGATRAEGGVWKHIYEYLKTGNETHLTANEQINEILLYWIKFDAQTNPDYKGMLSLLERASLDKEGQKQFEVKSVKYTPRDPEHLKDLLGKFQFLTREKPAVRYFQVGRPK